MVITTQLLFGLVVCAVALQRLFELQRSAKNEAHLVKIGGYESSPRHFRFMQAVHAAWFASMLLEVHVFVRPFVPWISALALAGVVAGQALRYAAMRALGPRWTVKIFVVPGMKPVTDGIYCHVRHPNYVGVVLELFFVPLLHSAYLTAIVFSLLNAWVLYLRIPR
jgi:methyltransferase